MSSHRSGTWRECERFDGRWFDRDLVNGYPVVMYGKYDSVDDGFKAAKLEKARYHLFLCLGPDCAPMKEGEKTWDYLKHRCSELKLPVMRTKSGCLKVCVGGPWLLVYPEGVWYGEVTPDRCERILQEHILQGTPVQEWAVRTHPLCGLAAAEK